VKDFVMKLGKAVVIGSGIGGLSVAIRLALKGYAVTVFEKNNCPGGKFSVLEKNGFHFDTGPSLFTQPEFLEELFILAGEPIEKHFSYIALDEACRYFFENGKTVHAYTNRKAFAAEMKTKLEEDPAAIEKYFEQSERLYASVGKIFLNHSLQKRSTLFGKGALAALFRLKYDYLFRSLHQYNRSCLRSDEAVQIFNRFATYVGSNPYQAPGMLSMIPHIEHNSGTYYPVGGMFSIVSALHNLALKAGVKFYFDNQVEQIIHSSGRVRGVVVHNEKIESDVVISNADIFFTYRDLLKDRTRSDQLLKQEPSSSALIFFWGMKREFPQLSLHNIFFSMNYFEEFRHLFKQKKMYSDPTIYVNISSKMEGANSPPGKENWFVMINAPAMQEQDWDFTLSYVRRKIQEKLGRMLQTDISSFIETEETICPGDLANGTGSFKGAIYGTSSNSKWSAFFRHPNFSSRIKGLYFVGGTVHPGGGIPLCLKSAKIVSELVS
jgi:phytoene desaturase